jgi:histone-lysine N-methyltransferase SETMAR
VKNNAKILTEDIARSLKTDISTVFRHLKRLRFFSKLDMWVPHSLTEWNKLDRVFAAISLLLSHEKEPFLNRIVTSDEKWIIYNNVRSK